MAKGVSAEETVREIRRKIRRRFFVGIHCAVAQMEEEFA